MQAATNIQTYRNRLSKLQPLIALFVLCVIMSFLSDKFLTLNNVWNVMRQISVNICISTGMTLVKQTTRKDQTENTKQTKSSTNTANKKKNGIEMPSSN